MEVIEGEIMIEYREPTQADLSSMLELYKQLNPNDPELKSADALEIWGRISENQSIKYFIAVDGSDVVATCFIAVLPNLTRSGRPIGFIENVVTDAGHRKLGIGKKVMEMAIDYARRNNCYKAILQSGNKRTEAHRFYEAIGMDGSSKRAFEIRFE
ncbi:MAG: GNAT family N-acetyltransferase [Treponemataceae bacterium]